MAFGLYSASFWLRRHLGLTEVRREKFRLMAKRFGEVGLAVLKHRMGSVGVAILVFFAILALAAPYFPLPDPEAKLFPQRLQPSWEHPFGTDHAGKDILSRVVWGSRISLTVGFLSSIIAAVLGTAIGLASGYWGGRRDEILMRVNDVFLSLPWLVLMLVIAAILREMTMDAIILLIGLTSWNFTARVVRAQVLSVKERVFVERARAAGAGSFTILSKHIFPNVFPLVFANNILTVAVAILSETTLAFLGRISGTVLSWGVILHEADVGGALITGHWAWIVMPGLAIVIVVFGFSLLGYALDEVLNPRLRER